MSDTRKKMLERVSALLAKAEATDYGAERDAFRAKADELMLKYAIDQSELIRREGRSLKDEVIKKVFVLGPDNGWMTPFLDKLLRKVARHARCEDIGHPGYKDFVDRKMSVVGMASDVEYVEMLFTSLRLEIANTLEPDYDHSKSVDENVYIMRTAGLKWERVEEKCDLKPFGPAQRAYERECERRGEEPRKRMNPKTVKRNFVNGFVNEVVGRLNALKREQDRAMKDEGNEHALVPVRNAVKEVFNEMFPSVVIGKNPLPSGKFDPAAYGRGTAAGARADLGQKRFQNKKGLKGG